MLPRPNPSSAAALRRAAAPRAIGGASSLLRFGSGGMTPAVAAALSPRPFVLTRQRSVPQQLTLFGSRSGR